MVEGRRFSSETRAADISMLPTEAIESTRILTGGASSIYGPNAVAGVVDIRLSKDFEGFQVGAEYGQAERGHAANERYSILAGTNTDRFRLVGSFQYLDGTGFLRQDRALTSTENLSPWGGRDWRSEYSVRPVVLSTVSGPDTPLVLNTDRVAPGETAMTPDDFRPLDVERDATGNLYGYVEEPSKRYSGHFIVEFDLLDDRMQLFAQGFYDDFDVGPSRSYFPTAYPSEGGESAVVPATNPYNPFGEDVNVLLYAFSPDEVRLSSRAFRETIQGATGVRGKLGEYRYEAGINIFDSTAGSRFRDFNGGPLVESLSRDDLSSVNLFGAHANSPAQLDGLATQWLVDYDDSLTQIDAKFSGPVMELPAGDLLFSVAVEQRESTYEIVNNEGDYEFFREVQFNGSSVERKVDAYAGELLIPAYSSADDSALLTFIELGVGTRYERFSDTGSEYFLCDAQPCESELFGANPKFDTQISQFTFLAGFLDDTLRLRAAYGGGFVSPTPQDLLLPEEMWDELMFDPITGDESIVTFIWGGNVDLQPEDATNITLGATYTPPQAPSLRLNIDFWRVNIENRITYPDAYEILLGVSDAGSVVRDPVTGSPDLIDIRVDNGAQHEQAGVDFGANYSWETGSHGFDTFVTMTYTDQATIGDQHRAGNYNWGEPLPRLSGTAGIEWTHEAWNLSVDVHHRSGVYTPSYDSEIFDYTYDVKEKTESYTVGSPYLGYDFSEQFSESFLGGASAWFGIDDLWDEQVPLVDLWGQGYDPASANIRGRYVYGGVRFEF